MESTTLTAARKFIRHMLSSPIEADTLKSGRELLILTIIAAFIGFGKIVPDSIEYIGIELKIDFTQKTLLIILFVTISYLSVMYGFLLNDDHRNFTATSEEKIDAYKEVLQNKLIEKNKASSLLHHDANRPTPTLEDHEKAVSTLVGIKDEIDKVSEYLDKKKKLVSFNFSVRYYIGFLPLIAAIGSLILILTFFFS